MLYFSPENVRYLTGFTGSNGQVLALDGKTVLFTDGRYSAQAQQQAQADDIIIYQRLTDALADYLAGRDVGTMHFEAEAITYDLWHKLSNKIDTSAWAPAPAEMVNIRMQKSDAELAALRHAVAIAEASFAELENELSAGMVEQDIALNLEWKIRTRGSRSVPFEFIVASGERSALPHGIAADRTLVDGDALTFDFGAESDGYYSDMTFAGSVATENSWIREVCDILAQAQQAAFTQCRPGTPVAEVDAAARKVIVEAGYGDAFKHSLGHGVGLAVHEAPRVSALSDEILADDMVITIEPGIYVDGRGGARLEDMVRVTPEGAELLTTRPKKHIVWG